MKTRAYVTLDGLRGVAAVCIVVLHCYRYFGDMMWSSAALAVDLFFVLSGFVLSSAYDGRFAGGMSWRGFIKARWVRLYPLYLLGFFLGTFAEILSIRYHRGAIELSPAQFWTTLPFAAVMLPAPGSDLFPFDIPMWSVFFELLINLVWAILWKPLRSNTTLIAIILLSGLGLLVSVASGHKLTTLGATWPTFAGGFFRVSYSFFVGVLLYRVRNARVIPQMPSMFLLAALPTFLFLPLGTGVQLIAVLFILPWFVLLGCRAQSRGWTRVISHQLGAASYGVYTLHYPAYFLSYAAALEILSVDLRWFDPWIGIAFIFAVVTACLILNLCYERPARKWLAHRFDATIVREGVTQAP